MVRPRKQANLVAAFRSARVLTLDDLGRRLSLSRSTTLRRLGEHGYFSSYNHAGRFLTIEEVAEFDSRELWVFKTARFSRHGTLKRTVEHFVRASASGMIHEELSMLLGVRAHNTLLDLVREGAVQRERVGPTFVYLSPNAGVRKDQVVARSLFLEEHPRVRPTNRQVIATLLELVRDPKASREAIVRRCQQAGASISLDVVDTVFSKHDLGKKRAL